MARERHFTRAAEACNITQPSLTRAIRKLEDELGGLLFDRKPGAIEMTELGRAVLPRFERAYEAMDDARAQALGLATMRRKRLRLGVVCTLGPSRLVDLLSRLEARIEGLEVVLSEGKSRDVVDLLIADEVDIAIASQPAYPDEIAVSTLFSERFVIAFRPGHRFERGETVALSEVLRERYVERLNCEFDDFYAAHFGEEPFDLDIRYSSAREDWAQAMILAGMGVSFVPESLPLLPGILTRPIVEPELKRELAALSVRGRPHSPVADAFIRLAGSNKW